MPEIGHNGINGGQLQSLIQRIERMEADKRTLGDDIKEVYSEAKGNGFDPKIMRKIVAMRRVDAEKRQEEETMLDIYMKELGMLPLFGN